MNNLNLSVREIQEPDIELIIQYWLKADDHYLLGMGVAAGKMPGKEDMRKVFSEQLKQPYEDKKSYCIIWLVDEKPIGHSNINKIKFGEEAFMHLHIWPTDIRQKGAGTELVKLTLPFFFKNMKLKKIYCEPYALNPAPNKTLEKVGFEFIKEYRTIPGVINFEQQVNLWELTFERFSKEIP